MDRIEEDFKGQLIVQRVNIQDPTGKSLAREYGLLVTPTFLLLDGKGTEVWRSIGSLDQNKIVQYLGENP